MNTPVIRVWQIVLTALFIFERQQKAMSEFIVESLGTVVDSPFEVSDLRDLSGQRAKRVDNFLDAFLGRGVLELEEYSVS